MELTVAGGTLSVVHGGMPIADQRPIATTFTSTSALVRIGVLASSDSADATDVAYDDFVLRFDQ